MQVLSRPLTMTEEDNRAALEAAERRFRETGDEFGNRQQRRKHERAMRKLRKQERQAANV